MYKPLDIAAYLVKLSNDIGEPLTNMKLQKLIYYVFAWYAVEKGEKLFDEEIFAWKYGPVITSVYDAYKEFGADVIKEVKDGKPQTLDSFTKSLIEEVFNIYGNKTAIELVNLTHSEAPWRDTFNPDNQNTAIPFEDILNYYKARKQTSTIENGKE
ncbi:MAG TPA: type II toxin-antitoxin system antitoxin SocA domain-containing protein [Candidatus Saccharimonadales bacterium]|nr:type II toxin-antitoxin system antitoxin SocA domain-containing protein [Candidatus Saccharimonadales bacterium]